MSPVGRPVDLNDLPGGSVFKSPLWLRHWSFVMAACAAIILSAPLSAQQASRPFDGQTLRVALWGGNTGKALRAAIAAPFEQRTGARIEWSEGDPLQFMAQLVAAKGGQPPHDIFPVESLLEPQAVEQGIVVRPDPAKLTNGHLLAPGVLSHGGYGPSWGSFRLGIAYLPEKLAAAGIPEPTDLSILYHPKLAGHVSIPDVSQANWPHFMPALAAFHGLSLNDPAPVLAKLTAIKGLSFSASSSDLETRMTSGEMWVAVWIDGRVNALKAKGVNVKLAPFGIRNPKAKGEVLGYSVGLLQFQIANPAKKALGEIFLNELISTPVQTKIALATGYTPSNVEALATARKDPKMGSYFASEAGIGRGFVPDYIAWNKVQSRWMDAWGKAVRR